MDNDERASTRPREKHSKRQKQNSQSYLPREKHYYKLIGTYLVRIFLPTHLLTYLPTYLPTQLVRIYLPPYFYLHAYLPTHFLLTYLMGIFYLPNYSTLIIIIIIIII